MNLAVVAEVALLLHRGHCALCRSGNAVLVWVNLAAGPAWHVVAVLLALRTSHQRALPKSAPR